VGYARVSREQQVLTAQRDGLHALGVGDDRIYVDHGLTGTNRERPGLRLALAACRSGDTLVVTKLDRLARSLPDARDILDELTKRNVMLSLSGSIHDPTDPVGHLQHHRTGRAVRCGTFNGLSDGGAAAADSARSRASVRASGKSAAATSSLIRLSGMDSRRPSCGTPVAAALHRRVQRMGNAASSWSQDAIASTRADCANCASTKNS
jgi:hypothetical protein